MYTVVPLLKTVAVYGFFFSGHAQESLFVVEKGGEKRTQGCFFAKSEI
jgi:hypothetical protein